MPLGGISMTLNQWNLVNRSAPASVFPSEVPTDLPSSRQSDMVNASCPVGDPQSRVHIMFLMLRLFVKMASVMILPYPSIKLIPSTCFIKPVYFTDTSFQDRIQYTSSDADCFRPHWQDWFEPWKSRETKWWKILLKIKNFTVHGTIHLLTRGSANTPKGVIYDIKNYKVLVQLITNIGRYAKPFKTKFQSLLEIALM